MIQTDDHEAWDTFRLPWGSGHQRINIHLVWTLQFTVFGLF